MKRDVDKVMSVFILFTKVLAVIMQDFAYFIIILHTECPKEIITMRYYMLYHSFNSRWDILYIEFFTTLIPSLITTNLQFHYYYYKM